MTTTKVLRNSGLILFAATLLAMPVFTGCHEDANSESNVDTSTNNQENNTDNNSDGTSNEDETGNDDESPSTSSGKICVGNTSIVCNDNCIDPMIDHDFCGAHKNCKDYKKCAPDENCELGVCKKSQTGTATSCSDGLSLCDGFCINPKDSQKYCGAKAKCEDAMNCGDYTGQSCQDGVCCLKFKDAAFKEYALGKWDKDKDGRICHDEVELVTEILEPDEKFKEMKTFADLNSFPNLKKLGDSVFADTNPTSNSETLSYIEEVGDKVFYRSGIKSISLPKLKVVNTSGDAVGMQFAECPNLTSVTLSSIETTTANMFKDSKKLSNIEVRKAKIIASGTFDGCEALNFIRLSSAEVLRPHAFDNSGLSKICASHAIKVGYNEDGTTGPVFENLPKLKYLDFRAYGAVEVSDDFIGKELASQVSLRVWKNKRSCGPSSPRISPSNASEWPANKGIVWKEIKLDVNPGYGINDSKDCYLDGSWPTWPRDYLPKDCDF